MRILVTGAFGNIGTAVVTELLRQGHLVRTLEVRLPRTERASRQFLGRIDARWGDVRRPDDVLAAVQGVDAIVHLAAILPPASNEQPDLAEAVNLGGTRHVLDAARAQAAPPRIFFASSFDLFGPTMHLPPPRRATDPIQITDHYTRHKAEGEALVRQSGLPWLIARFCDVPALRAPHPIMFDIPLDNRFEVMHAADAALAVANAFRVPEAWGQLLLIGGGAHCQIRYRDYVFGVLGLMGIGPLPEAAFTTRPYCTDWLDSTDSQQLLHYQRHTFQDILVDLARPARGQRLAGRLTRPVARRRLLRMSPYWTAGRQQPEP
jgi:nucleoside-diphosphate-sugar epimerase